MHTCTHSHACIYTHMHIHGYIHIYTWVHLCTHTYIEQARIESTMLHVSWKSSSSKQCPVTKARSWWLFSTVKLYRNLCHCPSLWLLWEHLHYNLVCRTHLLETNAVNRACQGPSRFLPPCWGQHPLMPTENLKCSQCWRNWIFISLELNLVGYKCYRNKVTSVLGRTHW